VRVAVQGCFANTPTAERELVQRLVQAAGNLGWEATSVLTSAEIVRFRPDCTLATHFTSPKLTEYPTLGLMANPPQYFDVFPGSLHNILSYDGYLTNSAKIRQYLGDVLFSTGKKAPVSELPFHLSCPRTEFVERPAGTRRLFYVGTRWDPGRHGTLFPRLARAVALDAYGPPERWADLPEVYRGSIPYDGSSVVARIRDAGVALCIHSKEHRTWGIPTMRIWEAAAAGAVVITDVADFAQQHFGDALLYIDLTASEDDIIAQIAAHMAWIDRHPEEATERARRAHAIFCQQFCLEEQLRPLPTFVDRVRRAARYPVGGAPAIRDDRVRPLVEYIVRAGTRPVHFLERCLASLRDQTYRPLGVIVVPVGSAAGLMDVLSRYADHFASLRVLPAVPVGVASQALWAGLRAVTAPYFAVLDDDDRLHLNHVATVMETLRARPDVGLAHSGGIRVQEEAGFPEKDGHLCHPSGVPIGEDRRLVGFAAGDRKAAARGDRCVFAHSWIARRELLDATVLEDPNLPVLDDVYLYAMLTRKGDPAFTWQPTAEWNWRSASRDNASFQEALVLACRERIRLRLQFLPELAALRREDDIDQALQREVGALRQELQAFGWVGSAEMLVLRRSSQSLLVLRGLRRSLRDWRSLRRRVWGGMRTVRRGGMRGLLRRMVSLGREE
jgi:hypothetical protein